MTVGHLYMQTNEDQNRVIHFARDEDGTLTEVERCPTGGSGCGTGCSVEERAATSSVGSNIRKPRRSGAFVRWS